MRNRLLSTTLRLLPAALLLAAAGAAATEHDPAAGAMPPAEKEQSSRFFSAEDGWLDVSEFLSQAYGFLPIAIPITEPAVGDGAAVALAFIDKPEPSADAGFGRPNLSILGALNTENGTRGAFGADIRYWLDDRLQTFVGGIRTSVNLEYYGEGRAARRTRDPRTYTLDLDAAFAQAKYRLGRSQNWLGLGFLFARTDISFDRPGPLPAGNREIAINGLNLSVSHDSRDNVFTPREGHYLELSAMLFRPGLGSDLNFSRLSAIGMHYLPLASRWTLGLRESLAANQGDAPFYMQPYIYMRGVPAMRYMGEKVGQIEVELRWQFWERFSLVGFAGTGTARNDLGDNHISASGIGLRYELARKLGLHIGFDFAWSEGEQSFYVQVGSAWMRP
ncbi:MAG TPA: BamA/TamA family outer membrane protein [Azonexus sp.]